MQNYQPVSEHRTQIYLPEETYQSLKKVARKQGVSMAEVIRKSIEKNIPLKSKSRIKKERDKAWKELMKLSGCIKGEPADFSSNISKYIAKMYKEKI
jgi:hypothetical protein